MPPTSPPTLRTHRRGRGAPRGPGEFQTAAALLGLGHPLVGLLYACHTTADEIVVVAAVQAAAVVLLWAGAPFALALAVAAAVVQLALDLRFGMLRMYRHELCRDLVIGGREQLPLAALRCELRRLRDPRRRAWLARAVKELADSADHPRREIGLGPPLYNLRVLAAVQPQLRDLARSLQAGGGGVRGVALLDRLITSGTSPLYGRRVGPLRDELGRIRYLLCSGSLSTRGSSALDE
jgi:hypothetical protein